MKYFKVVCFVALVGFGMSLWAFWSGLVDFAIGGTLISFGGVMIWAGFADKSGFVDGDGVCWYPSDSEPGMPISNMTGDLTVVRGGGNEFNAFNP